MRIGLTYDLKADGRHLLRAGYGTYFDFPYTNATILFPNAAVLSEFGITYQHDNPNGIRNADGSLFQPGDPLPPNQIVPDLAGPDEVAENDGVAQQFGRRGVDERLPEFGEAAAFAQHRTDHRDGQAVRGGGAEISLVQDRDHRDVPAPEFGE